MKKLLIAFAAAASVIVSELAMAIPANARCAGAGYRGCSDRGWNHRLSGDWGRGYLGFRPRVIAVAGAVIGGPLAAGYFYPVGYAGSPRYFGPGIYGSGFCPLIAYYGWPGSCY